ncbi:MAG: DUF2795 domain-containing protein [Chloroflexi bacterium]|nr:DUF2795 domain-containing protein [Chloroflexota bacterium]
MLLKAYEVDTVDASQWRQFLSRVLDYVGAAPYPATRDAVLAQAQRGNTPSDVMAALLRLPPRTYETAQEVVAQVESQGPPPPHVK